MLVKKIDPEWAPSENKNLKVGETIEITDAKSLILAGKVKAIGSRGEEVSAFDLYGEIIENEMEDYKNFMETRRQEAIAAALSKEKADLEAQLAESKVEEKKEAVVETPKEEVKAPEQTAEEKAKAEKVAKELAK